MSDTITGDGILETIKCLTEQDSLAITSLHNIIPDNLVTLKALEKSQEFYSSAFSNFTVVVSILAFFLIAFTVIALAFNIKAAKKLEKKTKDELEKVKKEQEKQKSEFEDMKQQFEEVKKQSDNKKNEIQDKIEELTEILENSFYLFLKKIAPNGSSTNIEIIIGSKKIMRIESGCVCNDDDYKNFYNYINHYDARTFRIIVLGHEREISYEKVNNWKIAENQKDEKYPNKIHIYFKEPVILYPEEKIEIGYPKL